MVTTTFVIESAAATTKSHNTASLHPTMVIFISVLSGVLGTCLLAAILIPLLSWWWRRRKGTSKTSRSARPTDNEKGSSTNDWLLARHERHMSDGQIPLLNTDSRSSIEVVGKKPHYRLASESRPPQSAGYVLDLYTGQSTPHDDEEGGRDIQELKRPLIQRLSLPPSPLSREVFVIQPETPPTRNEPQSNTKEQDATLRDVNVPQQQQRQQQISDAIVSRSSTLSTASIYSQTSVPSPILESVTPSLTSFPLPPTNVFRNFAANPPQLERTKMNQTTQPSDSTIIS